jgi:hypothetical protein
MRNTAGPPLVRIVKFMTNPPRQIIWSCAPPPLSYWGPRGTSKAPTYSSISRQAKRSSAVASHGIRCQKVEGYARAGATPREFDFTDRSGILFEWNDEIDKHREGLIEEDVVLYPTLAAEIPGVTLDRELLVTPIEDKIAPQGRVEDAAAANAGLAPLDRQVLEGAAVIDALPFEIVDAANDDDDNDDGILAVRDIPPPLPIHQPIPVLDDDVPGDVVDMIPHPADDPDDLGDPDDVYDDADPANDTADPPPIVEGLRRSTRVNRGQTTRYDHYGLLMHACRAAQGKPQRAIIKDGFVLFSYDVLSDATPIPVEDRDEYALGIILQQYSIGAGLKKFKERGEAGPRN